ncbi:hypothetical protein [Sorangium sp. So ce381]|uniref:hypothetical protein n=1 Tax=Sorangium sp. So ce381 TaxID=3133307 RepID=UPI003F5C797B
MAMQKKRKVLKAPFIVTVAAAASLTGAMALPGCTPTVSDGSCPESAPAVGSSCEVDDLSCGYGDDGCGRPIDYTCSDGVWEQAPTATCNPPPPPECPPALPAAGSACAQPGMNCNYDEPLPTGCPSTVTCGDDGTWSEPIAPACNPPPLECPPEKPAAGSACVQPGMRCPYEDAAPALSCPSTVTCGDDGTWTETVVPTCNPPAPVCPEKMPSDGDLCEGGTGPCPYEMMTGCGPMPTQAECVQQKDTWSWQVAEIFCNPPPPEVCLTAATEDACANLGPACRWLTPGCGDASETPVLAQAGCFPSQGCEVDEACPGGTRCQELVINPCYKQACDACGSTVKVCAPPGGRPSASP